jgi:hypothetical protein
MSQSFFSALTPVTSTPVSFLPIQNWGLVIEKLEFEVGEATEIGMCHL